MTRTHCSYIAAIAIFIASAPMVEAAEGYRIGLGGAKCAKLRSTSLQGDLTTRDTMREIYLAWVEGFVIGSDMVISGLKPDAGERELADPEIMWGSLLAYCRKNPEKLLLDASIEILNGLRTRGKR